MKRRLVGVSIWASERKDAPLETILGVSEQKDAPLETILRVSERQPLPLDTPTRAPERQPLPLDTPTRAPEPQSLPLDTPTRAPERQPLSPDIPTRAPKRQPLPLENILEANGCHRPVKWFPTGANGRQAHTSETILGANERQAPPSDIRVGAYCIRPPMFPAENNSARQASAAIGKHFGGERTSSAIVGRPCRGAKAYAPHVPGRKQ